MTNLFGEPEPEPEVAAPEQPAAPKPDRLAPHRRQARDLIGSLSHLDGLLCQLRWLSQEQEADVLSGLDRARVEVDRVIEAAEKVVARAEAARKGA